MFGSNDKYVYMGRCVRCMSIWTREEWLLLAPKSFSSKFALFPSPSHSMFSGLRRNAWLYQFIWFYSLLLFCPLSLILPQELSPNMMNFSSHIQEVFLFLPYPFVHIFADPWSLIGCQWDTSSFSLSLSSPHPRVCEKEREGEGRREGDSLTLCLTGVWGDMQRCSQVLTLCLSFPCSIP